MNSNVNLPRASPIPKLGIRLRQLGARPAYVKKFTAPSRFKASVDPELCTSCETCADRCFFDAVSMEGPDGTAVIDADKCMGCGICVPTCPGDAIIYEEIRQKEFIPE